MKKTLAEDSTSGGQQNLFDTKRQAGEDIVKALNYLVDNGEGAWTGYDDGDDEVWICGDAENNGELYVWTRDVGTKGEDAEILLG